MSMLKSGIKPTFKLSDNFMEKYRDKQPEWGFGDLSYFTFKRTYARVREDGTQEEFVDTLERVVNGVYRAQETHCKLSGLPWNANKAQRSAQEMFERMWTFKFLPPGRGLWMMGTDHVNTVGSAALNNCGFVSTEDIAVEFAAPFAWAMDMLMLGVGIGFDTKGAGKVTIRRPQGEITTYVIPDTREGWVESVRLLLNSYTGGRNANYIDFDYSEVRPAGLPIKGFGGTSSGPGPLREAHESIRMLLDLLDGKPIDSVTIVDIMNFIGKCVVAGNVRRSAELAIGEIDDIPYISMKDWRLHPSELTDRRWASNNSVFANKFTDFSLVKENILVNGEPGLIFLDNARHYGRIKDGWLDESDRRYDHVMGFNPCKPLRSTILTDKGYITFAQALEEDSLRVMGIDGEWKNASKPFKTGENRTVMRITLSNGSYLYGTENHLHMTRDKQWVELKDLEVGDQLAFAVPQLHSLEVKNKTRYQRGLVCGWVQGDGWFSNRTDSTGYNFGMCFGHHELDVIEMFEEMLEMKTWPHAQKPETCRIFTTHNQKYSSILLEEGMPVGKEDLTWLYGKDSDFKLGFLRSIFTADGSVRRGNNVELYSVNRENLEVISNVLREFGIYNTVTIHNNSRSYIASDGKVRNNKTTFKINVYAGQFKKIGFISSFKNALLAKHVEKDFRCKDYVSVIDIEPEFSVEDVYDITVEDSTHAFLDSGVITHNCAEQQLESYELCCLVETFPANHDTLEDYLRTLKFAYLYAKSVTLIPTHDSRTNSVIMRNRRIGTSMSGIQQAIVKFGKQNFFHNFCDKGYQEIKDWDRVYSRWLGVPESHRVTTVKPSGTVSLLAGANPGVHYTHSEAYYRLVRLAANSNLVPKLQEANFRMEYQFTDWKRLKNALDAVEPNVVWDESNVREYIQTAIPHGEVLKRYANEGGTLVVYFPVIEKNFKKSKFDVSIWEQMSTVREMQYWWADNSVSCTITVRDHEHEDLVPAIESVAPYVKTLSFLPLTDHHYDQAPYIEAPIESIMDYISTLGKLDLTEKNDGKISGSKFCDSDYCEI